MSLTITGQGDTLSQAFIDVPASYMVNAVALPAASASKDSTAVWSAGEHRVTLTASPTGDQLLPGEYVALTITDQSGCRGTVLLELHGAWFAGRPDHFSFRRQSDRIGQAAHGRRAFVSSCSFDRPDKNI